MCIRDSLLVVQLRLDELTVQTGDIGDTFALRTHGLTSAGVRTVTEAEFVHLGNHGLGTACSLGTTLRQQSQLAHLGRDEQHGRTVQMCIRDSYYSIQTPLNCSLWIRKKDCVKDTRKLITTCPASTADESSPRKGFRKASYSNATPIPLRKHYRLGQRKTTCHLS